MKRVLISLLVKSANILSRAAGLEFASLLPASRRKQLCKDVACSLIIRDYSDRQKNLKGPPPPKKALL